MRNVSRLRLHAHTLKVETAVWLINGSRVCDQGWSRQMLGCLFLLALFSVAMS